MEKYTSPEETLTEIRHLMERSSRFISLSGFSGIFAGIYALTGALAAYYYLPSGWRIAPVDTQAPATSDLDTLIFLAADALLVMVLAIGTGILLTTRRAKKDGNSLLDTAAKKLVINLAIPLLTGGVFCVALIYHGHSYYIPSAMLIFYGLALVHASKYTRDVVRSLGMADIALGLIGLFMLTYGLVLWTVGFGVLHIVYGAYMYNKYEK